MPKNAKPAKHTKQSFDDQQAIGNVSAWIAKTHKAMPDLKANDKWPNTDGYIQLVNQLGYPGGDLRVQIKKLHAAHIKRKTYSFTDAGKFLAFCRDTTDWIPTLFVGVDLTAERAYWLHINHDYVTSLGDGKTIPLIDSQVISATEDGFIAEWEGLIEQYKTKSSEFEEYKNAYATLSDVVTPALGLTEAKFERVHQFLDELNSKLDNEFKLVKQIFYPGAWKVGLAYSSLGETEISYTLYPIPANKNDVMIKQLSNELAEKLWKQGLGITMHAIENPILGMPKKYARTNIQDKVMRALKYRRLIHTGSGFLAREYIFAFIDKYHVQMNLKEKNSYSIEEAKIGFYKFLPLWLDEAAKLMTTKNRNNFKDRIKSGRIAYFNPDWIQELVYEGEKEEVARRAAKRLERNEAIPRIPVGSDQLPPTLFDEFIGFAAQADVEINRLYIKKDFSKAQGFVSNTLSLDEIKTNLDIFLKNFPVVYGQVIDTNFPLLKEQLSYREGADKVIFVLEVEKKAQQHEYGHITYFLKGPSEGNNNEIVFTDTEKSPHLVSSHPFRRTIQLNGESYQNSSEHHGMVDFIFEDTPMLNAIYKTLGERMGEYFDTPAN